MWWAVGDWRYGRFICGGGVPGTRWIGGWLGITPGLYGFQNPASSIQFSSHYANWAIPLISSCGYHNVMDARIYLSPVSILTPEPTAFVFGSYDRQSFELAQKCIRTVIYRVYTKEWCVFNSFHYWNRTILVCTPYICYSAYKTPLLCVLRSVC
jgi:hypothetical protein